jgi:copper chaperone NosL
MLPKLIGFLLLLILSGCSSGPDSGPEEVKWDRDNCQRCRMVLSDPHYAAEIRYFPEGKHSKVAKFDDIGCAVLWLEEQPWSKQIKSEIWVADYLNKNWIDARTAFYVRTKSSPMEYALGAQSKASTDSVSFDAAIAIIKDIEQKYNTHGQQLQQSLKEQAQQREALK